VKAERIPPPSKVGGLHRRLKGEVTLIISLILIENNIAGEAPGLEKVQECGFDPVICLDFGRAAENPGRKHDDGLEKLEDGRDRDPKEPEGEEEEPDDGVEKEGDESQGPAKYQNDQPQQEFGHITISSLLLYGAPKEKVHAGFSAGSR
jgi:hypothetical protein